MIHRLKNADRIKDMVNILNFLFVINKKQDGCHVLDEANSSEIKAQKKRHALA